MSVIIRLQNLPWSANSLDIRHYFRGLSIPEGGVHIVGGEMGDAFIAFSTDEDARQAMMLAGGKIKEVQITLMLSSRSEMQKVIEAARQASMTNSLAQLLGSQNVPPIPLNHQQQQQQQQQHQPQTQTQSSQLPQQQHSADKDRRDSKEDKKDSSDLSSSSYDTIRKDKKENSRSRSRDRMRKDRRDRDRDRDRRRRSRSRSRSRDRRRRRSHSRSRGRDAHGRDRERKDLREDLKKDKDLGSNVVHSLQDATNLPNLDILNPNQWRGVINPSNLTHNPTLNSLANLDLIRNFPGPKPLLPSGSGNSGGGAGSINPGPTPLFNNVEMKEGNQGERYQNVPVSEDMVYGNRSRGGEYNNSSHGRRDNRDSFSRDSDMNGGSSRDGNIVPDNGRGNFRNYDEINTQSYQGNFSAFGENSLFDIGNNFQNPSGFHQRNGNDGMNGNRYNNFNHGDGFPPKMVSANSWESGMGRGFIEFPMGMQNDGFNRNDRYDNHSRDDRVDEFGRSIQLRNWKNNVGGEKFGDEDFHRNQSGSFSTFHNRFSQNSGSSGPQPLLRNRDSWPPSRGIGQDGFKDRRGFRSGGGYDESPRGSFRNDHPDIGSRFPGRSRREEFHGRDRSRFGEKISRDDRGKCDRDSCVEIRGLSPTIAYGDVRRPFNSLKVIIRDIKFLDYTKHDKKCRLKFLNYENKMKALQNSKKIIIEGKHVQMLHINDSEFEDCIDEGVKRTEVKFSEDEEEIVSPNDAYIQVKDLLPEHTESDVAKALAPAAVERIVFENNHEGKVKTALVKFTKPIDAKVALNTPNRKIGDVSILLASLSPREFIERVKKMEKNPGAAAAAATESPTKKETADKTDATPVEAEEKPEATDKKEENDCITMKNLPYEANDRDICDFFSDIGLVPKRIHLMLDSRGQPSGNAYCEFSEPEQAQAACSKNGMPIGKNTLVVQQVSRAEMNEALGLKSESGSQGGSRSQSASTSTSSKAQCVVALENIPFRAGVFDIINFFGWSYRLTEDDICRRYNDQGQPTGDARVSFRTQEDALKAVRFLNNRHMMGRSIRMKII